MTRPSRAVVAVLTAALLSLVAPSFVAAPAGAHPRSQADISATARRSSPPRPATAARSILKLINHERAAAGLDELTVDPALAEIAATWSKRMARSNRLAHNPSLRAQVSEAAPGWRRLGENVGVGSDVTTLHRAFMASAGHRGNVLGNFDRIGIGVVVANGRTWVTVDFVRS